LRERLQLLDDVLVAGRDVAIAQRRRFAKRVSSGAVVPRLYFQSTDRWPAKERQQAQSVFLRRRQQILFDLAHHKAVFVLARHEAVDAICRAENSASAIRHAGKFELPM